MTPVLVDTGAIVAALDRDETSHEKCAHALQEITAALVTCEAVIAEACWLLRKLPGAADAVLANIDDGVFEVRSPVSRRASSVRALLKKYARVPMDLADACLVDLADELSTPRILTLDSDFRVYRWRKTRAFELLLDDFDD